MQAGQQVHVNDSPVVHPTLGMVSYAWRGGQVQRASAVHGLWLLQNALDAMQAMPADATTSLTALLTRTGGQSVMNLRLPRPLTRLNNLLVLK